MDMRGGISLIYSALTEPLENATYMLSWEQDLEIDWDLDTWHSNFIRSFKGILNNSLIEASLKVMSRWYLVPTRLVKYYPDLPPSALEAAAT